MYIRSFLNMDLCKLWHLLFLMTTRSKMNKIFTLHFLFYLCLQGIVDVDLSEHILLWFLIVDDHERSNCYNSRLRIIGLSDKLWFYIILETFSLTHCASEFDVDIVDFLRRWAVRILIKQLKLIVGWFCVWLLRECPSWPLIMGVYWNRSLTGSYCFG